jgi:hypothetical protein
MPLRVRPFSQALRLPRGAPAPGAFLPQFGFSAFALRASADKSAR